MGTAIRSCLRMRDNINGDLCHDFDDVLNEPTLIDRVL